MRKPLLFICLAALLLNACSNSRSSVTPTPQQDAVATQVSMMLTNQPTATVMLPSATFAPTETSIPTETATATGTNSTPTPAATVTPSVASATPTSIAGDPKTALGNPSWQANFDKDKTFGKIDNENTKISQANGALLLTGVNANGWLGWSLSFSQQPKNFYLEATLNPQTCAGSDQYGVMFRAPDVNGGYFYGFTCDGRYFLQAANFNDLDKMIVPLTASDGAIAAGANQTNRLGVMVKEDKISLYANGKLLKEVTDTSFKDKGYIGAFITPYKTAGFTVKMTALSLWNLP